MYEFKSSVMVKSTGSPTYSNASLVGPFGKKKRKLLEILNCDSSLECPDPSSYPPLTSRYNACSTVRRDHPSCNQPLDLSLRKISNVTDGPSSSPLPPFNPTETQQQTNRHNNDVEVSSSRASPNISVSSTGSTQKKLYVCSQCGQGFAHHRNYQYHVAKHEGTGKFGCICPLCGKYLSDRGYLSTHLKIHTNAKEYKCEWCSKGFNQRACYNAHVRIHTGYRPHKCETCDKSFGRKGILRLHMRTHTGEQPYRCSVCSQKFSDKSNLNLHYRLHTGLRPFRCQLCEKAFSKKHHLQAHINFHLGIRPYACPTCDARFSQSSNMKTHLKSCRSVQRTSKIPLEIIVIE